MGPVALVWGLGLELTAISGKNPINAKPTRTEVELTNMVNWSLKNRLYEISNRRNWWSVTKKRESSGIIRKQAGRSLACCADYDS